jgi:hypothetical protein
MLGIKCECGSENIKFNGNLIDKKKIIGKVIKCFQCHKETDFRYEKLLSQIDLSILTRFEKAYAVCPEIFNDPEAISLVQKLKTENEFLKTSHSRMQTENKSLLRASYVVDKVIKEFGEALSSIKLDKVDFRVNINTVANQKNNLNNILMFSDIHFSEVVEAYKVNGINEYNIGIAKERILTLLKENLKHARYTGANFLYIFMLGDIVSGIIHEELRETNESLIIPALLDIYKYLISLLDQYKSQYDMVIIYAVVGNHGRLTEKKKCKNKVQDNFEYLFYKMMETYFAKDSKIKMVVSESPTLIARVGDLSWFLNHGDTFKTSGNFLGLPIQGVARDIIKENAMFQDIGESIDAVAMAHFHKPCFFYSLDNKPIYINPSVIGGTDYSIYDLHNSFPPGQWSLVFDENKMKSQRIIYI